MLQPIPLLLGRSKDLEKSLVKTMKKVCVCVWVSYTLHEVLVLVSMSAELKNSMFILKGLTRRGSPSTCMGTAFDVSISTFLAWQTDSPVPPMLRSARSTLSMAITSTKPSFPL